MVRRAILAVLRRSCSTRQVEANLFDSCRGCRVRVRETSTSAATSAHRAIARSQHIASPSTMSTTATNVQKNEPKEVEGVDVKGGTNIKVIGIVVGILVVATIVSRRQNPPSGHQVPSMHFFVRSPQAVLVGVAAALPAAAAGRRRRRHHPLRRLRLHHRLAVARNPSCCGGRDQPRSRRHVPDELWLLHLGHRQYVVHGLVVRHLDVPHPRVRGQLHHRAELGKQLDNAGQWSKFEFHATSAGGYGYCQSVYNAATALDAYNTDTSTTYNASNSGSGGCGQFSHTTMTPYSMPAAGKFLDNWGYYVTVNAGMWYSVSSSGSASMYRVEAYGPN